MNSSIKNEDNINNGENQVLVKYNNANKKIITSVLNKNNNNNQTIENQILNSNSNDYKHKFYLARLKHGLIISFLALIPIQSLFLCVISYLLEDRLQFILEAGSFILTSILSTILLFYLMRNEVVLQKYPIMISLIIYFIISVNNIIPSIRVEKCVLSLIECSSFTIFNIIAIYSIMPIKKRYTIILATALTLSNYIMVCYYTYKTYISSKNYTKMVKKVTTILKPDILSFVSSSRI